MTTESDTIGIGIVGAGGIARARHVAGFNALPGVELVGVVNRSPESTEQARSEFGFRRTYRNWRELLEDDEVDAVVVATWPYLHAPVTLAALDAGKHVLTQARMAMNGDEAEDMLAASLDHPELTTMVVPSPFTLWADAAVKRVLDEGSIGTLRSVRVWYGGSVTAGRADPWRRLRKFSGNNVLSLGIVYEAIARWLGDATAVDARTELFDPVMRGPEGLVHVDVPDYVAVLAEFPGHVHATIEISSYASFGGPNSVMLFGSGGTLRVDLAEQRLEIATAADPHYRPVEIRPEERADWRVEAEFIGAIRGQEHVRLTDFATAVRYMRFTDAVAESAATGQRVAP